jgi:hypothetical protein
MACSDACVQVGLPDGAGTVIPALRISSPTKSGANFDLSAPPKCLQSGVRVSLPIQRLDVFRQERCSSLLETTCVGLHTGQQMVCSMNQVFGCVLRNRSIVEFGSLE